MLLFALLLLFCGFPGSSALKGPRKVFGQAGRSLTVTCDYNSWYEWHQKWWCRRGIGSECSNRIETARAEQVVRKDRVTIRDNRSQHRFTVTMEQLREDDAGTYWCGIKTTKLDLRYKIRVTVRPASTTTIISTTTTTTTTEETTDAPRVTRALSNTTGFPVSPLLPVISAVFPLLLLAASLLAWRKLKMKRQRTASGVIPEPDAQEEVSYAQMFLRPRDPEPIYTNMDPGADPTCGHQVQQHQEAQDWAL